MSHEQVRLRWAKSMERVLLSEQVADLVGLFLARLTPEVPPSVVVVAVQAALQAVDDAISAPVEVQADTIRVIDHREE